MKIFVLGSSNTIFVHSYIELFQASGYDVYFIDSSPKCIEINGIYTSKRFDTSVTRKKSSIKGIIKKIISNLDLESVSIFTKIIEKSKIKKSIYNDSKLEHFIKDNQPDVLFCFWSTSIRNEYSQIKNIIERNGIKTKYILDVPTYPIRGKFQIDDINPLANIDKKYFNSFDKIIFPSNLAKEYFKKNNLISKECDNVVSTCNFPKDAYINKNTDDVINGLVFLGHVDFSSRIQDNISDALEGLISLGLDIYIQESDLNKKYIDHVNGKGKGKIFEFKPFSISEMLSGKLSQYISRFSGVLCIYNETKNTRTELTYPTRFALALLSVKPIYLIKGIYTSLEEKYNAEQGVFFYENNHELTNLIEENKNKTFNRSHIHAMDSDVFL